MPAAPVEMCELIFPDRANHYGTLFGGNALLLMSKAAFVAAHRAAGGDVVMAQVREVRFLHPVPVGSLLRLSARIARRGASSLGVEVWGEAEGLRDGARFPCLQGYFDMVAVDGTGRPRRLETQESVA